MKDTTPLDQGWNLHHDGELLPATVPGCVHTDLLAAGRIPDPYLDANELEVAWIGRRDWTYSLDLPAHGSTHERTDLVFDGLDTVATVTLGDTVLGDTRNMHRRYRFDATGLGGPLTVRFTSAYTEAERVRGIVGERPNEYPEPFQYIRKMASSFGWDWGPTLPTAGIWKSVRYEHWSTARIADVRPLVTVDGATGRVEVHLTVERTAGGAGRPLTARATVAGAGAETVFDGDSAVLVLEAADVARWWPRGHGDQTRYELAVTLADGDGRLDAWQRQIGFRTVELHRTPDATGTPFTLAVNGEPLFVRGANWIPDDTLITRVTPARYRTRLLQAVDANVDLIRVWGGGIYEQDAFYDLCDELGLLVWQDFPFACAAYPEEQPLRGEIEAEARDNVVRLMPHPSLVLWNGNNENQWGFRDWGWEEKLRGDSWGEGYYLGLLPRIVAELDPTRPYSAGSPWSGSWDHHPNDVDHGTHHSWDVWNREDFAEYRATVPRFVAEFGWQAPPAHATLRRALPHETLAADSPGMLHHQKAGDGNGKLRRGLERHFDVPDDFDRWHYLTQLIQARAIATGIEHWRSHWPHCAGTIVWQLNDCWPVSSWAAVDGDGRRKPLHHELRRLYADRLLTLQPVDRDGAPRAALVNQSAEPWTTTLRLRRLDTTGRQLAEHTEEITVPPRAVHQLPLPDGMVTDHGASKEYLVADADGLRAVHFPTADRQFAYPRPEFDLDVTAAGDGAVDVRITARTLIRDLLLQPDRLHADATADRGLTTLLPGEQVDIRVHGAGAPSAEQVRQAVFCVEPS
ncbi:glycoside hydrolase family 2 protein [Kitasatospora sp. CB02891]|uniref:glycoside hydrolase family 2 protein n=1 Tax=Kitasatospora sp. CB02891 TaxID=2020329 RepID=UPI000C280967|nr:glycoside hydrolase family 2 protein [Kitasatospora sp. CB02891]PJN27945.1 beta-mannosidase [Kitasatospora sp. CB02891]